MTVLDEEVAERCGSPKGGENCLRVVELPEPVPADQRSTCTIGSLSYDPEPKETGEGLTGRMLQRGTTVTVTADCSAPPAGPEGAAPEEGGTPEPGPAEGDPDVGQP